MKPALARTVTVVVLAGTLGCGSPDRPFIVSTQVGPVLQVTEPPPAGVRGNTLVVPLQISGIRLVAADGDRSGKTGHLHAFIDREPVPVGQAIPKEPGVVHSTENPLRLYGLPVGAHRVTIVFGDGTHTRIAEEAQAVVAFRVSGPSVQARAPAVVKAASTDRMDVTTQGLNVVAPGSTGGHAGHGTSTMATGDRDVHLHYLIDPDSAPTGGMRIPNPAPGRVVHSGETALELGALPPGKHTVWVVAGTLTHEALDPLVADRVDVTVEP